MFFKKKKPETSPIDTYILYRKDEELSSLELGYKCLIRAILENQSEINKKLQSLKGMKSSLDVLGDSPYKPVLREEYKKSQKELTELLEKYEGFIRSFNSFYKDLDDKQTIHFPVQSVAELLTVYSN